MKRHNLHLLHIRQGRGELGQVIGRQQIIDLALNGLNPISLAGLTSGVIPGPAFAADALPAASLYTRIQYPKSQGVTP